MEPIDAAWTLLKQQGTVSPIDPATSLFPQGPTDMQSRDAMRQELANFMLMRNLAHNRVAPTKYSQLLSGRESGTLDPVEEQLLNHYETVTGQGY